MNGSVMEVMDLVNGGPQMLQYHLCLHHHLLENENEIFTITCRAVLYMYIVIFIDNVNMAWLANRSCIYDIHVFVFIGHV